MPARNRKPTYSAQLLEWDRRRKLVVLLRDEGKSFVEIGAELGVSKQRAQRIYADAKGRG